MGSRRFAYLMLPLAVALAGAAAIYPAGFGIGKEPAGQHVTARVERGDLVRRIAAGGRIMPAREVVVGAQASGQLRRLHVREGDTVAEGQLLAQIDQTLAMARLVEAEAALEVLRASLAAREAELDQAKSQHERLAALIARRVATGAEAEAARVALGVAEAARRSVLAQIRQATAALDTARANLAYTEIRAPMAGTVVEVVAREGQTLNANNEAPAILRLADLETMQVEAQVSEADIGSIVPDLPVYFHVLGRADRRWDGKVKQVMPEPLVENRVVFYRVLFEVANDTRELMSQMTAQVFFVLDEARDVPIAPIAAVRSEGERHFVRLIDDDGRMVSRPVRLGARDEISVAILDGLSPGERIVVREAGP